MVEMMKKDGKLGKKPLAPRVWTRKLTPTLALPCSSLCEGVLLLRESADFSFSTHKIRGILSCAGTEISIFRGTRLCRKGIYTLVWRGNGISCFVLNAFVRERNSTLFAGPKGLSRILHRPAGQMPRNALLFCLWFRPGPLESTQRSTGHEGLGPFYFTERLIRDLSYLKKAHRTISRLKNATRIARKNSYFPPSTHWQV